MLEPTPSLFYSIVSEVFKDRATFATRLVQKIQIVPGDNKYVKTLAIGKDGIILVNIEFWRKMIRTRLDAKIVILHELFHAMTGDISKLSDMSKDELQIANLSMDMRINAAITQCFLRQDPAYKNAMSFGGDILTRMYPSSGIAGLLRPRSVFGVQSKYKAIYSALYQSADTKKQALTKESKKIFQSEETIRAALKLLIPKDQRKQMEKIVFLGTHDVSEEATKYKGEKHQDVPDKDPDVKEEEYSDISQHQMTDDLKDEIAKELKDQLKDFVKELKSAGFSTSLFDNIIKVIESSRSINLKALENFVCNHKVNEIKQMWKKERRENNVVPIRPSGRDLALVAADIWPVNWHNLTDQDCEKNKNIAIYLDVSGSVTSFLPQLLGIIKNLHKGIHTIYCFSNEVHEHTIQDLSAGKYKSTGGTDFDCIAKHAIDNDVDKAVIFTDGYADVYKVSKEAIRQQLEDVAVVYFGESVNKKNFFHNEYKKGFDLQELTQ